MASLHSTTLEKGLIIAVVVFIVSVIVYVTLIWI